MASLGEGVWRTVAGRHIFIRSGQSLSSAMRESGKFKGSKGKSEKSEKSEKGANKRKVKMYEVAVEGAPEKDLKEQYKLSLDGVSKMEYDGQITKDEYRKAVKNINTNYIKRRNELNGIGGPAAGREYKNKLNSLKGKEDGTYNLDTGEKVDFKGKGYNVSFEQSTDNYTDREYYDKIKECKDKCDGNVYGGVFGGDPEISFYTKNKKVAMMIMEKYNQHSIWDNSENNVMINEKYDAKKNKVNYKN